MTTPYSPAAQRLADVLVQTRLQFNAWSAIAEGAHAMATSPNLHAGPYTETMWFADAAEDGLGWVHTGPCDGTPKMTGPARQVPLIDLVATARDGDDRTGPKWLTSARGLPWCTRCLADAVDSGGEPAQQALITWARSADTVGRFVHALEVLTVLEEQAVDWGAVRDLTALAVTARRLMCLARMLGVGEHLTSNDVPCVQVGVSLTRRQLSALSAMDTQEKQRADVALIEDNLAWVEEQMGSARERCQALLAAFPTTALVERIPGRAPQPWWDCANATGPSGGGAGGDVLTLLVGDAVRLDGSVLGDFLLDVALVTGELLAGQGSHVRLYRMPATVAGAAGSGMGQVVPVPDHLPADAPQVLVAAVQAATAAVGPEGERRPVRFPAMLQAAVSATI